jgi:hypothetical protein
VEVRCDEGVAIHIGPEPCAVVREGGGEASVGDCIGQPLSRERKTWFRAPTSYPWRKATRAGAAARVPDRPGVVRDPGMCGRSLCGNREISAVAVDER